MGYRKYILILLVLVSVPLVLKAQVVTYQTADSTSKSLFLSGDWKQLIVSGNQFINNGTDFPDLRLRIGFACYMLGNYSAAIYQYNKVLNLDSYNQTARYYLYLCHKYLNQDLLANKNLSYVDTLNFSGKNSKGFSLISACFESSYKIVNSPERNNAIYTRLGLSNLLFKKVQLDQSIAFYNQDYNDNYNNFGFRRYTNKDQQTEYFAKISYAIDHKFVVSGSYHYLYTNYQNTNYQSNLLYAGINFNGTYFNLHGDVNFGRVLKEYLTQYNSIVSFYLLGNFNLYFISRGSYQHKNSNGNIIYNQAVGFKTAKKVWLESLAIFGKLDDYIDADGLYVYNNFDNSKLKLGETVYYQFNLHTMLKLSYTYEKKNLEQQAINYNLHSITAGILWKF